MKKILLMSLIAANSYAATTNFYIHNWADTNSSLIVTNIVKSLATNVSLQNSAPQTNISVAGVTNAGTAAYSNASAFLLSSDTNWPLNRITNSGTASYSNASAFFLAGGTLAIGNVSAPGFIITNRNINGFTNESLVVFTNTLIIGTNGNIHSTNQFQVATLNNRKTLEVTTAGNVVVNAISSGNAQEWRNSSGSIVTFVRNDGWLNSSFGVGTDNYYTSGGGTVLSFGTINGTANGVSAINIIGVGGNAFLQGPSTGNLLVSTNVIAKGSVTASNTYYFPSNTYPITVWSALGNSGCCTWNSNGTLYLLCTNSIGGTATTNRLGGI